MLSFKNSTAADLHVLADVLTPLTERSASRGIDVMLVGAMARDVVIHHALGTRPSRATRDIDIAVAVSDWAALTDLMAGHPSTGAPHSFRVAGVQVDVVPFRGVESPDRTIRWPNDHEMNVLGFEEALAVAVPVEHPGGLVVKVASLPAQSILKLLAWTDRRLENSKDALA